MGICQVRLVFVLSMLFCWSGCWRQQDIISIRPDGTTIFTSEVIITEKGFSVKDLAQLSSEFMKELTSAGWRVEMKWVSRAEPYRMLFSGVGNIRTVKSAPDFYQIQKINDKVYAIKFVPVATKNNGNSRRIRFERGFFVGGPRILDERGREIKKIENVLGNRMYRIVF